MNGVTAASKLIPAPLKSHVALPSARGFQELAVAPGSYMVVHLDQRGASVVQGSGSVAAACLLGAAAGLQRNRRGKHKKVLSLMKATVSDLSKQARLARKNMQNSMKDDEELNLMMQGLRGANLNDSDRQADGVVMQLVDIPTDD